ncbi:MAG: 30S ribosome-binding factor RbfA [Gemmatimonadales bacterium]
MAGRSGKGRRPDQVGEVIRQVVAEALIREVRDPRVRSANVMRVEVTPDLSVARIFVTLGGDEAEQQAELEGLERAAGFLRTKVAQALDTRITPELQFLVDRGREHAARIDQILADLRREETEP